MSDVASVERKSSRHVKAHRAKREEEGFRQSNIWLPEDLHDWVADQVSSGRYRSRSEAVVDALTVLARSNRQKEPQTTI